MCLMLINFKTFFNVTERVWSGGAGSCATAELFKHMCGYAQQHAPQQ
jgi:hypothetical protein